MTKKSQQKVRGSVLRNAAFVVAAGLLASLPLMAEVTVNVSEIPPLAQKKSGGWFGVSAESGEAIPIEENIAPTKQNFVTKTPVTSSTTSAVSKIAAAVVELFETPETSATQTDTVVTPEIKSETESENSENKTKSEEVATETKEEKTAETSTSEIVDELTPRPLPTEEKVAEEKSSEVKVEVVAEKETAKETPTEIAAETDSDEDDDVGVASSTTKPEVAEEEVIEEESGELVDGSRVGDPFSATKIRMLYDEVIAGIQSRGITGRYQSWTSYARRTIRGTEGTNTGTELDGRCRLDWYRKMYDEPIKSVMEVDQFSRDLHDALSGNHLQKFEGMKMIRQKLDCRARGDSEGILPEVTTPAEALQGVIRALTEAQAGYAQSMSYLSREDQNQLANNLYDAFCKSCTSGHTIPNRSQGRQMVDIGRKMDMSGYCRAAEALTLLTNKNLLENLSAIEDGIFPRVVVGGQQYMRVVCSAGDILIGGHENKIIDLDAHDMRDVVCIINRGGNNVYREGTVNLQRPLLVIIDLDGDDVYTGAKPGIQGGAIMGVSALIDASGNNTYTASDVAQGSAIFGVGLLFDLNSDGKTTYKGFRRVQGHALAGIGVAVDGGGNDEYRAALWAQGFGAPRGIGVLENAKGNDWYYCGGQFLDSYPEHPGYDGWGQGVGAGIRQVANGGIGIILDGAGDDLYEVDYFGHGGGYWMGLGFARDFGGNDKRMGTTKMAYSGQPRSQKEWTRFANGWGCHYSLGYLFDDGGNDIYGGQIMGTGMAWDLSIGFLLSLGGSDTYSATGGMTQGSGAEGSIGILFSYGGNDTFLGRGQGIAGSGITYHSPGNCGGNFSFVVNYGGEDKYGSNAPNNAYTQRGSVGGFLIDRPFHDEYEIQLAAAQKSAVAAKEKYDAELAQFESSKEGKNPQQQRAIQMQIARLTQQFQKTQMLPQKSTIGAVTRLGKEHLRQENSRQAESVEKSNPASTVSTTTISPTNQATQISPASRPTTK